MKKIPITQGKFALVDDQDFATLTNFKWHAIKTPNERHFYASRNEKLSNGKYQMKQMHRYIVGAKRGELVDHIDGNGLNNTRSNLRICSHLENARNRRDGSNNTSGFKGVSWHKKSGKWLAGIRVNKKRIHLGLFSDAGKAAVAYNEAALHYHKNYASPNKL